MNKKNPPVAPGTRLRTLVAVLVLAGSVPAVATDDLDDLIDLSLNDLLSLEVSSASRKLERVRDTAAAVYVVTADDIRRTGATSVPEALAMVPGVQASRINSHQWAVSIRGFTGRFSNKLLVLVDGRTIYRSSFSGTYWEELDMMMPDIDRIEVIRGPGATLWGSNAVNGIINIITKPAADTQGGLLAADTGSHVNGTLSVRGGGTIANNIDARIHAKYRSLDDYALSSGGGSAGDGSENLSAGFRMDGVLGDGSNWTAQGDAYRFDGTQLDLRVMPFTPEAIDASGWNLLGRWQGESSRGGSWTLQSYVSHTERDEHFAGQQEDVFDVDLQHRFPAQGRHEIVWGLGYRRVSDQFRNTPRVSLLPDSRHGNIFSAFIQDEITLVADELRLIVGTKVEDHYFTGTDVQPNVRAIWQPADAHTLWASVAKAVRTPSRAERDGDIVIPSLGTSIFGNPNQQPEELVAYEVGYRYFYEETLSLDAAFFYNDYDNLWSTELVLPGFDQRFDNLRSGDVYGLEFSSEWRPEEDWRLRLGYSYIEMDIRRDAESLLSAADPNDVFSKGTPKHSVTAHLSHDIDENWDWDLWAIYKDDVPTPGLTPGNPSIPAYLSLNTRLAWRPAKDLELAVLGNNLLDSGHMEYIGEEFTPRTEVPRSVTLQAQWAFE